IAVFLPISMRVRSCRRNKGPDCDVRQRESMADARRFPRLELPFGLVGAAVGFLSVELLSTPRLHFVPRDEEPAAVIAGAIVAALVGLVARAMCTGRKYAYEMDVDASARAPSDLDAVHAILILTAGTIVG